MLVDNGSRNRLFFRLNSLIKDIEASRGLYELDNDLTALLNNIAEADFNGHDLRVTDILKLLGFGTPPTIFRRLGKLADAGWVLYEHNPDDRRVRFVRLTPSARQAFDTMAMEVFNALMHEVYAVFDAMFGRESSARSGGA